MKEKRKERTGFVVRSVIDAALIFKDWNLNKSKVYYYYYYYRGFDACLGEWWTHGITGKAIYGRLPTILMGKVLLLSQFWVLCKRRLLMLINDWETTY